MRSTRKLLNRIYDTVIVGGGPVGSSCALHLALRGHKNIAVIEQDCTYKLASSMLSAGGIRQQFSVPENIKMSCYSAEFLTSMEKLAVNGEIPDIQFHQNGYLFLGTTVDSLTKNVQTQNQCGAHWINSYSPSELKSKFPWLNTEDLAIGSFSSKFEGYFDPWSLVAAMKNKAISLGVQFIDGEVVGAQADTSSATPRITAVKVRSTQSSSNTTTIPCGTVVNAAGAWASPLIQLFANATADATRITPLPVRPRKRCIFLVHCPARNPELLAPPSNTPLVVDPSGAYFRPEGKGNRYICGISPPEDSDPDCSVEDLRVIDHHLFEETIWPSLCHRVPAFEELKVQSSWAGFYEYNTLDQNAIIGPHPGFANVILCNGFSGHGLQQSPAAGRAVSELLTSGQFETIDLRRFSFNRILTNSPIFEEGIV